MSHDDFAFEPIPGLPGVPPEGEEILWQGRPNALALARDALMLNWVIGYFTALAVWRVLVSAADMPFGQALATGVPFLALGVAVVAMLYGFAWAQARATVYTITNRRVAMRIGAALSVTLNLPYRWVDTVGLDKRRDGTGTIALRTKGETRISYLVCWPHVRPWRLTRTEPALRSVPGAGAVAALLAEAAEARVLQPKIARTSGTATAGNAVAAE